MKVRMNLYPAAILDDGEMRTEDEQDEEEVDEALEVRERNVAKAGTDFAADFQFDLCAEKTEDREMKDFRKYLKKSVVSTLEDRIAAERERLKSGEKLSITASDTTGDLDQLRSDAKDSMKNKKKKVGRKSKESSDFFDELSRSSDDTSDVKSFDQLSLSRPTLKAVASAGFSEPTPIQAACIPAALAGRDICACAATGTGKTAAFVLPILERLLHRSRTGARRTRVLVLTPTRELAIQIFQVFRKLSMHSQLDICLCAGGLDLKAQEAALRACPDVVVATPGRLLDHLHNTPSFTLASIEVLVLDEADRMLEEAFEDQMKEVIRLCSRTRQTLLFSATMTDQIDELASMSLQKPMRIFINENTDTALKLRQEFIRIRAGRESDREAIVAALVTRTFTDRCIVFVRTKRDAQRLQILLGLLGVRVGQLHGGLTQTQRLEALNQFKKAELDTLISTDLASRGLDIEQVHTVINMSMPRAMKAYIHRVGRTARAGRAGRSISLVGEGDRKVLKQIIASNSDRILKQRLVAPEVVEAYRERISSLEESITRIDEEEKMERVMRAVEQETKVAEAKLNGEKGERDGRVWFKATSLDKLKKREEKQRLRQMEKKETAKPASAEDVKMMRLAWFQARAAKRSRRGQRMRAVVEESDRQGTGKTKKKNASSFTSALTSVGRKGLKRARHGPDDAEFRSAKIAHGKRKKTR